MNLDSQIFLKGIQLLLGSQLIIVALLHFSSKPNRSKLLLSVLCLINGLWFFKHAFNGHWNDNFLLFLLIGPGKPIFVGAVLLLYFQSFSRTLTRSSVLKTLAIPFVYYVILLAIRFPGAEHMTAQAELRVSIGFSLATLFIFWYYFFLTRKEISKNLKHELIPKAYYRLRLLFFSLYFFLLQIPIWDICEKLVSSGYAPPEMKSWLEVLYSGFFKYAGYQACYIYIHFLGYFIFLYALSELPFLKKLLLPKEKVLFNASTHKLDFYRSSINAYFIEAKAYQNPEITIESSARETGVPKSEFSNVLKQVTGQSFKGYINQLRVEEFKRQITDESNQKFDMVGIALKCGFNSKATFFRVFKSIEGITPKEYQLAKN